MTRHQSHENFGIPGCRVISTPLPDVVSDFKGIVRIGQNADEIFKRLIGKNEPELVQLGIEIAAKQTWDTVVNEMEKIIIEREMSKKGNFLPTG